MQYQGRDERKQARGGDISQEKLPIAQVNSFLSPHQRFFHPQFIEGFKKKFLAGQWVSHMFFKEAEMKVSKVVQLAAFAGSIGVILAWVLLLAGLTGLTEYFSGEPWLGLTLYEITLFFIGVGFIVFGLYYETFYEDNYH